MSHTIGAHSDDRGGESDRPCYCDTEKSPPSIGDDELRKQIVGKIDTYFGCGLSVYENTLINELMQAITQHINTKVIEARIDELK